MPTLIPVTWPRRIAAFLRSRHQEDGGFSERDGEASNIDATRFAVDGLLILNEALPNRSKITGFVTALLAPDGGFRMDTVSPPSLNATYYALRVLRALGLSHPNEQTCAAWINAHQQRDGSFVEESSGLEAASVIDTTYYAMSALELLRAPPAAPAALSERLRSLQTSGGGFAPNPCDAPTVEATYCALRLLLLLRDRHWSAEAARGWLESCINGDGGIGPYPGAPSALAPTYWATHALDLLGRRHPSPASLASVVMTAPQLARTVRYFCTDSETDGSIWLCYCAVHTLRLLDCEMSDGDFWQRRGLVHGDTEAQAAARQRFYATRRAWRKAGVAYVDGPDPEEAFLSAITTRLPSAHRLLDLGCGEGSLLFRLREVIDGLKTSGPLFVGLDLSPHMLTAASNALRGDSRVVLVVGDAYAPPFPDGHFSLVISRVAPYSVEQVYRLLRSGGVFVLYDQGGDDFSELHAAFGSRYTILQPSFADVSLGAEAAEIERCGLVVSDIRNFRTTHFFTRQAIEDMIAMTPLVEGFDSRSDAPVLDELERRLSRPEWPHPNRIAIARHHVVAVVTKP